jgi:hypothetical protein
LQNMLFAITLQSKSACKNIYQSISPGECIMRKWLAVASLSLAFCSPKSVLADLWIGGHGDIGIGLVGNTLDLHLHFADAVDKEGGGSIPAGEYAPGDHTIFVPGPSVDRPPGSQWDFLGAPTDKIWFLPASSDPNKPYLGWATEELSPADFNGNITVRLTSLLSAPANATFSVWSLDPFGSPTSLMSTANGISNSDQFLLAPANHEHFFVGFTQEGLYDIEFTAFGNHKALGDISGTGVFKFAVGVPEPSSMAMLAMASSGGFLGWLRRRKNSKVVS